MIRSWLSPLVELSAESDGNFRAVRLISEPDRLLRENFPGQAHYRFSNLLKVPERRSPLQLFPFRNLSLSTSSVTGSPDDCAASCKVNGTVRVIAITRTVFQGMASAAPILPKVSRLARVSVFHPSADDLVTESFLFTVVFYPLIFGYHDHKMKASKRN
jgi:hypothetical protein